MLLLLLLLAELRLHYFPEDEVEDKEGEGDGYGGVHGPVEFRVGVGGLGVGEALEDAEEVGEEDKERLLEFERDTSPECVVQVEVVLLQHVQNHKCHEHVVHDVRQVEAVKHGQRPNPEHHLQPQLQREVAVLHDLVQHLLVVLKALSLVSQALDLPGFPDLVGYVDDAEDELHDDEGAGLLGDDEQLDSWVDSVLDAEEEHGDNDVEDYVEEH